MLTHSHRQWWHARSLAETLLHLRWVGGPMVNVVGALGKNLRRRHGNETSLMRVSSLHPFRDPRKLPCHYYLVTQPTPLGAVEVAEQTTEVLDEAGQKKTLSLSLAQCPFGPPEKSLLGFHWLAKRFLGDVVHVTRSATYRLCLTSTVATTERGRYGFWETVWQCLEEPEPMKPQRFDSNPENSSGRVGTSGPHVASVLHPAARFPGSPCAGLD